MVDVLGFKQFDVSRSQQEGKGGKDDRVERSDERQNEGPPKGTVSRAVGVSSGATDLPDLRVRPAQGED